MLEDRLRRAHAHIRDLQQHLPPSMHVDPMVLFELPPEVKSSSAEAENEENEETEQSGDDLDSMMNGMGRLTTREKDQTSTFFGGASGFAFLAKTRELLEEDDESSSGRERGGGSPQSTSSQHIQSAITRLFDEPLPDKQELSSEVPVGHLLPSHGSASALLRIIFEEVYPLVQFVDRQSFQERIDRLYDREPYEFEADDHKFLPLFYVAMGLGMLFSRKAHRDLGCGKAVAQA